MILTKLSLSLVVGVGLAVGFGGLPSYFARAEKPASDKSDKAAKKEVGASIRGHVKSVDADKNKLVLTVHTGTGKETTEKFLDLAAGARVYLEDATEKVNELPRGELSDLKEGTEVTAQLDAAGKKVIMVSARGPGLHATFKSAGQDTFVIETKGSDGPVEETITMVKGAKVLLHDGLSKEDKDQESELSKISAGSTVWLQLTVDRKRALSVRPQGTLHFATLRKLDSGNNSITVTVKENGQLVDKTFTLAKNAMTDTNIAEGGGVTVRMSLFNENIAVEVRARE